MPDPAVIRKENEYTESKIVQIYIESEPGVTHRIRKRESAGSVSYTETAKKRIDEMSCIEDERDIGEADFLRLSAYVKGGTRPIIKTRYTFSKNGQLFEIDVYPDWERTAIMETELEARTVAVEIPDFIEVVKDVTGDYRYSNAAMSREFPTEVL